MPIIEKHHVHPYSNAVLFHSGHRPDLPPGRQSRLTTSENGRVCLVFKSAFIHSLILQWRMTFRATVDCCPARRLRRILAAIVWSSAVGHRGTRPGGADLYKAGAPGWERGVLVHIGVRSICAGIAALAIGFGLESVGRRVVGAASAGLRAESALFSVFETIRLESLPDHRASLVRVASLETAFAFEPAVEESEPPASTSRHASFGERFLFDQELASFDERFAGADISVAETEDGESNVLNYAHLPSPGPGEHAIAQPTTGPSTPKLAPAALSPPASAARKRSESQPQGHRSIRRGHQPHVVVARASSARPSENS